MMKKYWCSTILGKGMRGTFAIGDYPTLTISMISFRQLEQLLQRFTQLKMAGQIRF